MSNVIPSDVNAVGNSNHTPDHNNICDVLGLLAGVLALGAGGGSVPANNAAAITLLEAMSPSWGGTAGQTLISQGNSAAPLWGAPVALVLPTGDNTGVKDTAAIQPLLTAGIPVLLAAGNYYIGAVGNTSTGLTVLGATGGATPGSATPGGYLAGSSHGLTKLFYVGNGTAVYCHGTQPGGAQYQGVGATIRNIEIDGSLCGATATVIGLDVGDQYDLVIEAVTVSNFTSSGSTNSTGANPLGAVGIGLHNYNTLSEKTHMRRCVVNNCTNAFQTYTQSGAGTTSRMYSDIELHVNLQPDQNGWVMARQGHLENGRFTMYGNFNCPGSGTNTAAAIVCGVGSVSPQQAHSFDMEVDICVEADPTSAGALRPTTIAFGTNADNTLTTWRGRIQFSYAGGWQAASGMVLAGGSGSSWQFSGRLHGDANLFAALQPYTGNPVNGTTYTNNGPDAVVYATGGTVSSIVVNGTATGLTSGAFLLPTNATIQFNFSGAPTTTWISALAS